MGQLKKGEQWISRLHSQQNHVSRKIQHKSDKVQRRKRFLAEANVRTEVKAAIEHEVIKLEMEIEGLRNEIASLRERITSATATCKIRARQTRTEFFTE